MISLPVHLSLHLLLQQTDITWNQTLLPRSLMASVLYGSSTLTSDLTSPSPNPDPDRSILVMEQQAALVLVLLLLVLLAVLMVRCFRILLDPYRSLPSSTWTHHLDQDTWDYRVS